MIDANNGNVWTPPGKPADLSPIHKIDDWCTSDEMFDARNKIEDFGKLHPGEDVSLTVKFRSGVKVLSKTSESIKMGDNWMTIDGELRHRFACNDNLGMTIGGWGDDATWGEKRNYGSGDVF